MKKLQFSRLAEIVQKYPAAAHACLGILLHTVELLLVDVALSTVVVVEILACHTPDECVVVGAGCRCFPFNAFKRL